MSVWPEKKHAPRSRAEVAALELPSALDSAGLSLGVATEGDVLVLVGQLDYTLRL